MALPRDCGAMDDKVNRSTFERDHKITQLISAAGALIDFKLVNKWAK